MQDNQPVKVGISGLAVSNRSGLGRLARIYLIALARMAPGWELHAYLRSPIDMELLEAECDTPARRCLEALHCHFPPLPGLNRLLLESIDLPRQFAPLGLDAYLGLDFTLPPRPLAPREVVVLPDLLPFTRPATVSWRARILYRRGISRSIARRARLLCISAKTEELLKQLFPAATDVRVVYPALSPLLWQYAQQDDHLDHPLQVRGSLHPLVAPGRYALSVGVAGPRKNTALLVQAFTQLVHDHQYRGSLILIGGDGRYHTAPRGQRLAYETAGSRPPSDSHASAEIYDIGRVNDFELSQLYRHADLLVSLSAEEGFGFPVLEALAHGTPALVTAGSAMLEIAQGGIAATGLEPAECRNRLGSALGALELLRREAARLDLEHFSVARLGQELVSSLTD